MRGLIIALFAAFTVTMSGTVCFAHMAAPKSGEHQGLEIASLGHDRMQVLSKHRAAILSLAQRQAKTDVTFRRLLNYSRIQYVYCLWGLMPGAIVNEESPFNACSHAYLAGAVALLDYMASMPDAREEAKAILDTIETDQAASGEFSLCSHSADVFYTGEFVSPAWSQMIWLWTFPVAALLFVVTSTMVAAKRRRPIA